VPRNPCQGSGSHAAMIPSSVTRLGFALLAGWLLIAAGPLAAAEGGFTATLSNEQRETAGLAGLEEGERAALDQLVADDLAFARREKVTVLEETFLARHDESLRKQAGLNRLTPAQLAKLNQLVAAAVAARPTPKERPRLRESEVVVKRRAEIHGSITVAYGWGAGGRDFRAGSLWLDYYDPESRIGIGVGLTSTSGGGYYGYYPGYYPDRFYPGPYSFADYADYYEPTAFNFGPGGRGDFSSGGGFQGDGASFHGPAGGHGGGRRH
jgi:hypothetical protein